MSLISRRLKRVQRGTGLGERERRVMLEDRSSFCLRDTGKPNNREPTAA